MRRDVVSHVRKWVINKKPNSKDSKLSEFFIYAMQVPIDTKNGEVK